MKERGSVVVGLGWDDNEREHACATYIYFGQTQDQEAHTLSRSLWSSIVYINFPNACMLLHNNDPSKISYICFGLVNSLIDQVIMLAKEELLLFGNGKL
ncbi:hypothetical protein F8388_009224 [Cannabis sativa]|uniref:Uncharacterized protein n=1 Tax=Cannabis sativa TaxID=3483 RepID=A0A7J6GK01_CANSA|nr:hypothetical protein F8388_009224 [Cannabis sativa]